MSKKTRDRTMALDLLEALAEEEAAERAVDFIAPRLANSPVRTRLAGLIQTFEPSPRTFEGWGVFRVNEDDRAQLVAEAPQVMIDEYLGLLPEVRMILVGQMRRGTWLAWPADESRPLPFDGAWPVHLIGEGRRFETVVARLDGETLWFDDLDLGNDPVLVDALREALIEGRSPDALSLSGLAPEQRSAYALVFDQRQRAEAAAREREAREEAEEAARQRAVELQEARRAREREAAARRSLAQREHKRAATRKRQVRRDRASRQNQTQRARLNLYAWTPRSTHAPRRVQRSRQRHAWRDDQEQLRVALRQGGGRLLDFERRGDHWLVYWQTARGRRQSSAVRCDDLTVISSGICLNGRDRDFDLQSLVGVIDRRS